MLRVAAAVLWGHVIRNDHDYTTHIDYCHRNPLKHGLIKRVADWPYSTAHRYVARGIYLIDWTASATLEDVDG